MLTPHPSGTQVHGHLSKVVEHQAESEDAEEGAGQVQGGAHEGRWQSTAHTLVYFRFYAI